MRQKLAAFMLTLFGWQLQGHTPAEKKILIIGAPHTSNWDFPLALLALAALGLRFSWVGKHTLFTGVAGRLLRNIGGIPVNRKSRHSFLNGMVEAFRSRDTLTLALAPEGTRSYQDHWKAGFYHIAVEADIAICLGFVDYAAKTVGLGPTLRPTKDIEEDFASIRAFYQDKTGKYPERQSMIVLRTKELALFQKKYPAQPPDL